MKDCCLESARSFFVSNYPLSGNEADDHLAARLVDLCKKWGPITSRLADGFYIRCTNSLRLGVDAKTAGIQCTCGGYVPFIFIGSRLFYFIWRINMVCLTYWGAPNSNGAGVISFEGSSDWPKEEHLRQVGLAIEMYFGQSPLLSTQGLEELNKLIAASQPTAAVMHTNIVDLAELFVLFHEIQHQLPLSKLAAQPPPYRLDLANFPELPPARASRWTDELTHDANAVFLLLESVASVLATHHGMAHDDARTQAAILVCTGADAALHTLQLLEEMRHGRVSVAEAASARPFKYHPPSLERRNLLSVYAYSLITEKDADALRRREFTPIWKSVAGNVAGHMRVRDTLFERYKAWRK